MWVCRFFPESRSEAEVVMKWLVILSGAHWRDIVQELFHEHVTVKGWSTIECDEVDVAGEMVELRCGDFRILVPHSAILTAVAAQSGQLTQGDGPRGRN
jgi:hypothetical protein